MPTNPVNTALSRHKCQHYLPLFRGNKQGCKLSISKILIKLKTPEAVTSFRFRGYIQAISFFNTYTSGQVRCVDKPPINSIYGMIKKNHWG